MDQSDQPPNGGSHTRDAIFEERRTIYIRSKFELASSSSSGLRAGQMLPRLELLYTSCLLATTAWEARVLLIFIRLGEDVYLSPRNFCSVESVT